MNVFIYACSFIHIDKIIIMELVPIVIYKIKTGIDKELKLNTNKVYNEYL